MDLVIQSITTKYATFSGRAPRKEYWLFVLAYLIVTVVLSVVEAAAGLSSAGVRMGVLTGIFWLAALIPYIAVSIRRMHDTDRVGWWVLIAFVPLIGTIWYIILTVLQGTAGENRYGPDPYG